MNHSRSISPSPSRALPNPPTTSSPPPSPPPPLPPHSLAVAHDHTILHENDEQSPPVNHSQGPETILVKKVFDLRNIIAKSNTLLHQGLENLYTDLAASNAKVNPASVVMHSEITSEAQTETNLVRQTLNNLRNVKESVVRMLKDTLGPMIASSEYSASDQPEVAELSFIYLLTC